MPLRSVGLSERRGSRTRTTSFELEDFARLAALVVMVAGSSSASSAAIPDSNARRSARRLSIHHTALAESHAFDSTECTTYTQHRTTSALITQVKRREGGYLAGIESQ